MPIWTAFMAGATTGRASRDFWTPDDVYEVLVDATTGEAVDSSAASESYPAPILVALKAGEPTNNQRTVAEFRAAARDSSD